MPLPRQDLGYNDLGIRNGGKTITPTINELIRTGVTLSSYYTFRLCSPTRASLMSGRCKYCTTAVCDVAFV